MSIECSSGNHHLLSSTAQWLRRFLAPVIGGTHSWHLRAWAMPACLALLLLGCGGGGVGSGGTGGFAAGPITGFGSVIVNGVRFDDSTAAITDADGRTRSRDELRLGMTVEVDSGPITTDTATGLSSAAATRIKLQSGLRGAVSAVNLAAGSFTLLGQRVLVTPSTLFGESLAQGLGSLSGPGAPAAVEVYAEYDTAANVYRAYRVDTASANDSVRLQGQVQQIDTVAQTVRIGGVTYRINPAAAPPAGLAAGQFVSLQLQLRSGGDGLDVKSWDGTTQAAPDLDEVKLRGVVSAYVSLADFSVDGRRVNASNASIRPTGAALALGSRVQVEGPVRGGVLQASSIEVARDAQQEQREFEITGAITAVVPTGVAGQPLIVVRGQSISTARSDLRYDDGTAAQLVVGRRVEVKGVLGADRRILEATRIKFQ